DGQPPAAGRLQGLRVFAGYAGWSGGQLEGEVAEGAWVVVDARDDDLVSPQPELLWSEVLRRHPAGGSWSPSSPRASAESIATGPPSKRQTGALTRAPHVGRTSSMSAGVGRFTMTPSAPSSSWSSRNTTLRQNGPSSMTGVATSRRPWRDSMPSMMPTCQRSRRRSRSSPSTSSRRVPR
ncbi:MAG: YqgE/AlgH family protein, partial [Actinomycetales bacterium]